MTHIADGFARRLRQRAGGGRAVEFQQVEQAAAHRVGHRGQHPGIGDRRGHTGDTTYTRVLVQGFLWTASTTVEQVLRVYAHPALPCGGRPRDLPLQGAPLVHERVVDGRRRGGPAPAQRGSVTRSGRRNAFARVVHALPNDRVRSWPRHWRGIFPRTHIRTATARPAQLPVRPSVAAKRLGHTSSASLGPALRDTHSSIARFSACS